MTVTVVSASDVRFTFKEKRPDTFCLIGMTIEAEEGHAVVWEVRRQNGSQAPCASDLRFPAAPSGYDVVRTTPMLRPGRYAVSADGGIARASGQFTIPSE